MTDFGLTNGYTVHNSLDQVLRKAVSNKQFLYLVSAVLQPIVGYKLQFSYTSVNVYKKWDKLLRKNLKLKTNLPRNFSNEAIFHFKLYGLKTFGQLQAENSLANLALFANLKSILGRLFKHRAIDLQAISWMPQQLLNFPVMLSLDPVNFFLAGVTNTLALCKISLSNNLPNVFRVSSGILVVEVLGSD
ncbi:hypothetical protein G9A89_004014 [Geosiphon pyriformis]|nr:hypothetical protein G9A89_004014 [Geosiphon pyriformis]